MVEMKSFERRELREVERVERGEFGVGYIERRESVRYLW